MGGEGKGGSAGETAVHKELTPPTQYLVALSLRTQSVPTGMLNSCLKVIASSLISLHACKIFNDPHDAPARHLAQGQERSSALPPARGETLKMQGLDPRPLCGSGA